MALARAVRPGRGGMTRYLRQIRANSVARLNSLLPMAELARAVASLRVVDEDLVPSDVSAMLGCEPTQAWSKGDSLASHGVKRTASFGLWRLQAPDTEPADLDAQVSATLSRLTDDLSVWASLGEKYEVHLFCGWFMEYGNEGISITPGTLSALGARGILLDVDLYAGDSDKVSS